MKGMGGWGLKLRTYIPPESFNPKRWHMRARELCAHDKTYSKPLLAAVVETSVYGLTVCRKAGSCRWQCCTTRVR